jgi:hypothetical protein
MPIHNSYRDLWSSILLGIPTVALQSVLSSLFSSLLDGRQPVLALDDAPSIRALVKREADILEGVIGRMTPSLEGDELWEVAIGVILNMNKEWTEFHARVFVCWISGSGTHIDGDILPSFDLKLPLMSSRRSGSLFGKNSGDLGVVRAYQAFSTFATQM